MSGVNWNVELKKLERELDGLPPQPSAAEVNARRAAERRAQQRMDARSQAIGASARLVLVAVLAAALGFWPYARSCGAGLFTYMGVEALIVAGALWVTAFSWRARMVRTHALALLLVLSGLVLLAMQILPRVGYAKVEAATAPTWMCVESPVR